MISWRSLNSAQNFCGFTWQVERIAAAGGCISFGRVGGVLPMTRGLGNFDLEACDGGLTGSKLTYRDLKKKGSSMGDIPKWHFSIEAMDFQKPRSHDFPHLPGYPIFIRSICPVAPGCRIRLHPRCDDLAPNGGPAKDGWRPVLKTCFFSRDKHKRNTW